MARIVVLGIFVADATYRAQRLPRMGETVLGDAFSLGPGGKGSNQAVAAARAGGDVAMLTRLGRDPFADMALDVWAQAGVAFAGTRHDIPTGSAFIFVDSASGDNAIIVAPGVAATIEPSDLDGWADEIAKAAVFVTQLEQPQRAAQRGLEIARNAGVRTILNPAPGADLPDAMLALADIVTPNETEAEALTGIAVTGIDSAERAARRLIERGAGAVIVTLGANGALCHADGTTTHIVALSAGPVVETTGAGDAFNGGLATALSEGLPLDRAVRFANATAALSVTQAGAAASMPPRARIDALLARG
ncbi:PfkB [Oceaniovalibus guishaninsula JLT2003]|uniref:Ribokinase n=1 Tax=Oceaniovalibus guishaninsula JLT2003 TaxID=1231392 RepID=K2HDS1_9RHOB|nr:ribokinase [Oceaniovalibus guishaninsula]EKE44652.1 PfkB [Oceaniovalibus guishaninsula JLT2003]